MLQGEMSLKEPSP